jgi:predicted nucleic acid-binding protein
MNDAVCVDASLIVSLLLPGRQTEKSMSLWEAWTTDNWHVLSPALLGDEVTSALYRKVSQGTIKPEDGQAALAQFLGMDIEHVHLPELHVRATELARKFGLADTYDAHYLAVAEHFACPFWTADEKLHSAVKDEFDWVKWVGE